MKLELNGYKIIFDKETKDLLKILENSDNPSLQMFGTNVLGFVPEFMKITTNNGTSFSNKKIRIDSVETEEILKNNQDISNLDLTFFEFQNTLNFNEVKGKLEISATLRGVTKFEREGKEFIQKDTEIISCTKFLYDKNEQSGMLIENFNQEYERKHPFIIKNEEVFDCEYLNKTDDKNKTPKNVKNKDN